MHFNFATEAPCSRSTVLAWKMLSHVAELGGEMGIILSVVALLLASCGKQFDDSTQALQQNQNQIHRLEETHQALIRELQDARINNEARENSLRAHYENILTAYRNDQVAQKEALKRMSLKMSATFDRLMRPEWNRTPSGRKRVSRFDAFLESIETAIPVLDAIMEKGGAFTDQGVQNPELAEKLRSNVETATQQRLGLWKSADAATFLENAYLELREWSASAENEPQFDRELPTVQEKLQDWILEVESRLAGIAPLEKTFEENQKEHLDFIARQTNAKARLSVEEMLRARQAATPAPPPQVFHPPKDKPDGSNRR